MKKSDGKGIANRTGPEPCADVREDGGEASVGVRAGWVLSREIHGPGRKPRVLRGADVLEEDGRQHRTCRYREARWDPARSETPSMRGNTALGNREVPLSSGVKGTRDRIVKPKGKRR